MLYGCKPTLKSDYYQSKKLDGYKLILTLKFCR